MTLADAKSYAEIGEKLAVLIWPLIGMIALIAFRRPLLRALERFSDDGGTVELFGAKFQLGKATEQQQGQIEDLAKQLKLLSDRVDRVHGKAELRNGSDTLAAAETLRTSPGAAPRSHPRVLWVDDNPGGNALIAASLRRKGFDITTALSTAEAQPQLVAGRWSAVVSDMGRAAADDGVTLTRLVRTIDRDVPVMIFCSGRAAAAFGDRARAAGATIVTDSTTVLTQALLALQSE